MAEKRGIVAEKNLLQAFISAKFLLVSRHVILLRSIEINYS